MNPISSSVIEARLIVGRHFWAGHNLRTEAELVEEIAEAIERSMKSEREACRQVADDVYKQAAQECSGKGRQFTEGYEWAAERIEHTIRARGNADVMEGSEKK